MSKITPKFKGHVENGKLKFEPQIKDCLDMYICTLDGFVDVTIKKHSEKKIRSDQQNKYYWKIPIKMLSDKTGDSPDDWHNYLKKEILAKNVVPEKCRKMMGEIVYIPSTTELTTVEMSEYCEQIRRWAAQNEELRLNIPEPNEVEYEENKK